MTDCANIKAYGWHHRLKACDAQSLAKVITPLVYHMHRKFQDKFAKGGDVHGERSCSRTEWISFLLCLIYLTPVATMWSALLLYDVILRNLPDHPTSCPNHHIYGNPVQKKRTGRTGSLSCPADAGKQLIHYSNKESPRMRGSRLSLVPIRITPAYAGKFCYTSWLQGSPPLTRGGWPFFMAIRITPADAGKLFI